MSFFSSSSSSSKKSDSDDTRLLMEEDYSNSGVGGTGTSPEIHSPSSSTAPSASRPPSGRIHASATLTASDTSSPSITTSTSTSSNPTCPSSSSTSSTSAAKDSSSSPAITKSSSAGPPPPSQPSSSSTASTSGMGNPQDWMFIKIVARIALQIIRKFWAFSSAAVLAIILFYWLFGGFTALMLVFFGVSGILYHASDRLLYHPDQPSTSRVFVPSPSMVQLPFESVYIKAKDKTRLHLFLIKQPPERFSDCPTIIFLHGNAGNIGHRLLNAKGLYTNLSCNICLLEYRGYGHSDGVPCEEGLYMDAQAGLDYLSTRTDINASKIIVFGRSLGGAVAIELGSRSENRDKISCILIENTFLSIPDIARTLFNIRLVRMLPNWFYKNQFKSRWKVCRISVPTLFLSGSSDQLIPSRMMTELYNSCGAEEKKLARFPGGSHNETWTCPQYYATVRYFLEEIPFSYINRELNWCKAVDCLRVMNILKL